MIKYLLFIDGSADPRSKIAFGSFLLIPEGLSFSTKLQVESKFFNNSSSSKVELETLLYILKRLENKSIGLTVYSDSNLILNLMRRRKRLEQMDFRSKSNRRLNYHLLYREFYTLMDHLDCKFIKVKGHSKATLKDEIDDFFSLVDRASRKALRSYLKSN